MTSEDLTPSTSSIALCVVPFSTLACLFGHFVDYGVASILRHTRDEIDINEQIFIRHSCT